MWRLFKGRWGHYFIQLEPDNQGKNTSRAVRIQGNNMAYGLLTSCSTFWSNMGVYWNIGPSQLTRIALIDETAAFGEPLVPGLICGPASWFSSSDSPCSMKLTRPVWANTWAMKSQIQTKTVHTVYIDSRSMLHTLAVL